MCKGDTAVGAHGPKKFGACCIVQHEDGTVEGADVMLVAEERGGTGTQQRVDLREKVRSRRRGGEDGGRMSKKRTRLATSRKILRKKI